MTTTTISLTSPLLLPPPLQINANKTSTILEDDILLGSFGSNELNVSVPPNLVRVVFLAPPHCSLNNPSILMELNADVLADGRVAMSLSDDHTVGDLKKKLAQVIVVVVVTIRSSPSLP